MQGIFQNVAWGLLFVIAINPPASGQVPGPASPERDTGWFAVGAGWGSPGGLSAAMSANFGRTTVAQAAFHGATGILGGEVGALHAGVGGSIVGRWSRVAVFAGAGLVSVDETGRMYSSLGFVPSAQAVFTPVKELGLGLDLFAILTRSKNAVGLSLTLVFEGNK